MPVVIRSTRFVLLVCVVLAMAGCAQQHVSPAGAGGSGPCANGVGKANRQAPIVCVDDSNRTLSVHPDPVTLHDVAEGDRRSPVMLHWYTRSGSGDLQLELEEGCVAETRCDGRGHCWARSVPGARKQCKYDVWINGGNHDRLDPTVIVEPCCR